MAEAPPSAARKLYLDNCARCHGETGDGQGTTQLDRPARSFLDGGFSFGNTPEALFRTISVGIPGTPMPSFELMSESDRRDLAAYVITLGPPVEEVKLEDTILTVRDRPLVVRGMLPPLSEGLPDHPRGLLVGDPTGITFEYSADDVRLLALRQGDFVRRTDWTGRGGTPLEPLGKVVFLVEGGKPETLFYVDRGQTPLSAHLASTAAGTSAVTLDYHLIHDDRELAHATETPRVLVTPHGTGFSRSLRVFGGPSAVDMWVSTPALGDGEQRHLSSGPKASWSVWQVTDGPLVCTALRFDRQPMESRGGSLGRLEIPFALGAGDARELELSVLTLTEWSDAVRAHLESLFAR